MNNVQLSGRLTKDPDVKFSQDGTISCARFTLAVDRKGKKQEGKPTADFISCVAFSNTATFVKDYLHKGTKIVIDKGRIQSGSYVKEDGQKVYTTDIVADSIEFAESKSASNQAQAPAQPQAQVPPQQAAYVQQPQGQPQQTVPAQPQYTQPQAQYAQAPAQQAAYVQPQMPQMPQGSVPVQTLQVDPNTPQFI